MVAKKGPDVSKPQVLIADDDGAVRTVLNQAFTRAGLDVRITSNASTLMQWIASGEGRVVVSDVIMPDGEAFDLLPSIKKTRPELPVILISAQNTFMTALKAQEAGAYEYLPKPFDLDELTSVVMRALDEPKDNRPLSTSKKYLESMPLVGRSAPMQSLYRSLARLVNSDLSVMLSGEQGTGKRLMARVLHEYGNRKQRPFLRINLSTIPSDEIETHLFGNANRPGAFGKADGGTLYLEEVHLLPGQVQAKLLRVLMEGEYLLEGASRPSKLDLRLICSSSENLQTFIVSGEFLNDLFYRIAVVPLTLPPLRERNEDIPDLARHFLKTLEMDSGIARHLNEEAIESLKGHDWPGNVRELENLIQRLGVLHPQETITCELVERELQNAHQAKSESKKPTAIEFANLSAAANHFTRLELTDSHPKKNGGLYHHMLWQFEKPVLERAMEAMDHNQLRAAELLGINRNTLRKKLKMHGIGSHKTQK